MTDNYDDYIPFEGVLKSRILSKEETDKHRQRLKRALERRKTMRPIFRTDGGTKI